MVSVTQFHPVVEDQRTAAQAYFACVVGVLVFESALQLPTYLLSLGKRNGMPYRRLHPSVELDES